MIILPAIDLVDGQCVRLQKGDFDTVHKVAESPAAAAQGFREAGAAWLHMVDLDGAKAGAPSPRNREAVLALVQSSGLKIELGGGIRTLGTVEDYLAAGVSRVILGSAALQNPALVREACAKWGGQIAVGIDAREGYAAAQGWLAGSSVHYLELAKAMEQAGVGTIIYTDIARDGMLGGLNLEQLEAIDRAVSCGIIASGGVRDIDDIRACAALSLYGVICGKAVYTGSLSLGEAIAAAGEQREGGAAC